jgi:hypothetical protein
VNVITCPGCRRPLHVPDEVLDQPVHCPHCRVSFRVPKNSDGTFGQPQPLPPRAGLQIPRPLVFPAFGLLILGLAGTMVNGYLTLLFALQPGADVEFARGRVREVRSTKGLSDITKWEPAPHAAIAGVAAGSDAADLYAAQLDEELAQSWAPGMLPLHLVSTMISAVVMLGGLSIVRGKLYFFALFACVAAMVNVNHLCCLPGGVIGLWSIFMLVRDDNRKHFGR